MTRKGAAYSYGLQTKLAGCISSKDSTRRFGPGESDYLISADAT